MGQDVKKWLYTIAVFFAGFLVGSIPLQRMPWYIADGFVLAVLIGILMIGRFRWFFSLPPKQEK